jgi:hypothetical protein
VEVLRHPAERRVVAVVDGVDSVVQEPKEHITTFVRKGLEGGTRT